MSDRTERALERIADELGGIRAVLETFAVSDAPAETGCQHPDESRSDFGSTDGRPDWECRLCGYRSLTALVGA